MYRQTDGIAMGSPLGPVLANIFVGYNENKLFDFSVKPQFCKQYVDDTFAIFKNESECDEFFNIPNSLNPALKFTSEKEKSKSLDFLDVKIGTKPISNKLARFQSLPKFGPNKCPVYLKLPWIGNIFLKLKNKINLLLSIVSEQLNHESFSQPEKSFYPSTKMLCLPFNKVWSYTNMCAAVIANT